MMGRPNPPNEASAMAARGGQYSFNNSQQGKDEPRCDHCHKIEHTKERCWDLHGKPEDNQFPSRRYGRSDEVKFVIEKIAQVTLLFLKTTPIPLELHISAKNNLTT